MAIIKTIIVTVATCVLFAIITVIGTIGFMALMSFILGAYVYNVSRHL